MSSFANLRAVRQTKDSKSYVKPKNESQEVTTTPVPLQPSTEGQKSTQIEAESTVHVLPSSLEVRRSSVSGRGLWSKAPYKPGKCWGRCGIQCLIGVWVRWCRVGYEAPYCNALESIPGLVLLELFWTRARVRLEALYNVQDDMVLQLGQIFPIKTSSVLIIFIQCRHARPKTGYSTNENASHCRNGPNLHLQQNCQSRAMRSGV